VCDMENITTPEKPIVLRATITREELAALKIEAIRADLDVQDYLANLIREDLAVDR
jgi:hypothetical protein